MKIIFITGLYYPYIGGGAELSNKLLVEGLKNRGIDVEVFTLGVEDKVEKIDGVKINRLKINSVTTKYLEELENKNIKNKIIERLKRYIYKTFSIFNLVLYKRLFLSLKETRGEILHISGVHMFFPILWWKAAKKNNMKVICTLRDPVFLCSNKRKIKIFKILDYLNSYIYKYYIYKYVDCIHSPSEYMLNLHEKNKFKFKNKKVIPNTTDIKNILVNFKEKNIDILYVGRLSEEKGINTLVKAVKVLNKKVVFVGDGELKDKISNENIKITGWISKEETYENMKKSKVLILPSEWEEAFGRVLIEAVANGCLVIGSDRGAIPEVLNYDERYIFKEKEVEELQKKFLRILNLNENEYQNEVLELQKYMEKYNYKNHINEFEKFYRKLLKIGE